MSLYRPPLKDLAFLFDHVFDVDAHAKACGIDCDSATVLAIAEEASKFASAVLDPLNRGADTIGAQWTDAAVTTPPGYRDAYAAFCAGGWNGLRFPEQYGGQGLCAVVATAVDEMWHAAGLGFALCPMLTSGAIEALLIAGSETLKRTYLEKLVSGAWTGTMNLTEPQAGSDLAAVRCKAIPQEDGSYRLHGQKIFITYGDHDLAENIVHLVLARTQDAPAGVKGLSLFVVPKFLVQADGAPGARNDVRCASIEHKLGIHGSPTAVMLFGETDGAVGHLVGAENRGLETMFIMMNEARYAVGLQGLALSDRAFQHALDFARERVQGRAVGDAAVGAIVRHPDVRRLLLAMSSRIEAMRALALYVALQKDLAHHAGGSAARTRMELLIPVMKGWLTETAQDVSYDALQVFGGAGFIEETGAAQYYRDARILTIYEGTTAIQANDLVGRKTLRDGGAAAFDLIDEIALDAVALRAETAGQRLAGQLTIACDALRGVVAWLLASDAPREVYAGAVPYLELWGIVCGGWMHARRLRAGLRLDGADREAVLHSAAFFGDHYLAGAPARAAAIVDGGASALAFPDAAWDR